MKRKMKKSLAVLLTLSICFSTINIEAMAEEDIIETQTDENESDFQHMECGN